MLRCGEQSCRKERKKINYHAVLVIYIVHNFTAMPFAHLMKTANAVSASDCHFNGYFFRLALNDAIKCSALI